MNAAGRRASPPRAAGTLAPTLDRPTDGRDPVECDFCIGGAGPFTVYPSRAHDNVLVERGGRTLAFACRRCPPYAPEPGDRIVDTRMTPRAWLACAACAPLIEAGRERVLIEQAIRQGEALAERQEGQSSTPVRRRMGEQLMTAFHGGFWRHRPPAAAGGGLAVAERRRPGRGALDRPECPIPIRTSRRPMLPPSTAAT